MLRAIPRMAAAVAHTAGPVYQLGRYPFLAAVPPHAATPVPVRRIAEAWLAFDAARGAVRGRPPLTGGRHDRDLRPRNGVKP
jgi:hypothetical protein